MKTVWVSMMLGMLATNAVAEENWQAVSDSQDGTRLIVDINSITLDEYDTDKQRVYANMRYITPTEAHDPFITVIDAKECVTKQSGKMFNIYSNGDKQEFFWSVDGNKMYDNQGKFLCLVLFKALDKHKSNNTRSM